MEETIIIENDTVYKVIPETPEVPAIPAVPEQKIEFTESDLVSELNESSGILVPAQERLRQVENEMRLLTGKKDALQKLVDKEKAKQESIFTALKSFVVVETVDNTVASIDSEVL